MYTSNNEQIIFAVTLEDLQNEAKRIVKRELSEDEIHYATKGIESGFAFSFFDITPFAIRDAVVLTKKEKSERER